MVGMNAWPCSMIINIIIIHVWKLVRSGQKMVGHLPYLPYRLHRPLILTCFTHQNRQASRVRSECNCMHRDSSIASTDVVYRGQGARWSSNQWPPSWKLSLFLSTNGTSDSPRSSRWSFQRISSSQLDLDSWNSRLFREVSKQQEFNRGLGHWFSHQRVWFTHFLYSAHYLLSEKTSFTPRCKKFCA